MVELGVEHVLLFVVTAFLLYRLMGSCGCSYDNGFSVGINNTHWFSDAVDTVKGWDWMGTHVTRGTQKINNRYK